MAVPRNRHSNARKLSKRAHQAKKPKNIFSCSNCGRPHLPHRMCSFCGFYRGKAIIHEKEE